MLSSTVGLGVTQADILDLVEKEFLQAPVAQAGASAAPAPATENKTPSGESDVDRYKKAYPIAIRITAALGLRGFRLNLAVEGAGGYDDLVALLPAIAKSAPSAAVKELAQALGVPPP
ncbi:hypothetical protein [Hydrogenophaga sp. RWCD_12]|uniref:hypothetical protein n=1 Tax=Hydrogenophaga sp. RWCD_12 TaxID=3391190 RepID=UPI003984BB04